MTLNGIIVIMLLYSTTFGSFGGQLRQSSLRYTFTLCDTNLVIITKITEILLKTKTLMMYVMFLHCLLSTS